MKSTNLLLFVGLIVLLLSSCDKKPDLGKLDGQYIVKTNNQDGFDFGAKTFYYVGKEVYVVDATSKDKAKKWIYGEDQEATEIIDAITAQMDARGYTRVDALTDDVDFNIITAYMKDLGGLVYNYWWSYWDYWYGPGWGWGYYPSYGYPIYPSYVYSYEIGALEIDMIDHQAESIIEKDDHVIKPVVWSSYATGLNSNSGRYNTMRVISSINQSFEQSPYINKK